MSRCLISGGAGFIGTHLARELLGRGHRVTSLDLADPQQPVADVTYVKGDVCDEDVMTDLMLDVDVVYHFAAVVGFARIQQDPVRTIRTSAMGADVVLRHARWAKCRVMIASSSMVYGRAATPDGLSVESSDAVLGSTTLWGWWYAYGKAAEECLALAYHQAHDVWVCVVRPFNVVGALQSIDGGFVLPRFVRQALRGDPLTVYAPGTQMRTFVHVEDVARGFADLAECEGAAGQVVNLGGVETVTVHELAHKVLAMTQSSSPVELIERPYEFQPGYDNVSVRVPDLQVAQRLIGYAPRHTLYGAIRDVIREEQALLVNR